MAGDFPTTSTGGSYQLQRRVPPIPPHCRRQVSVLYTPILSMPILYMPILSTPLCPCAICTFAFAPCFHSQIRPLFAPPVSCGVHLPCQHGHASLHQPPPAFPVDQQGLAPPHPHRLPPPPSSRPSVLTSKGSRVKPGLPCVFCFFKLDRSQNSPRSPNSFEISKSLKLCGVDLLGCPAFSGRYQVSHSGRYQVSH